MSCRPDRRAETVPMSTCPDAAVGDVSRLRLPPRAVLSAARAMRRLSMGPRMWAAAMRLRLQVGVRNLRSFELKFKHPTGRAALLGTPSPACPSAQGSSERAPDAKSAMILPGSWYWPWHYAECPELHGPARLGRATSDTAGCTSPGIRRGARPCAAPAQWYAREGDPATQLTRGRRTMRARPGPPPVPA
jgi:hypothetical protein